LSDCAHLSALQLLTRATTETTSGAAHAATFAAVRQPLSLVFASVMAGF
jgi:hypothetical protein